MFNYASMGFLNPGAPSMSLVLKSIRAASDATRLRIIALLEKDELSVQELQEITRTGQSRISTHLGLLLESGLVQSRREGKRAFYSLNPEAKGPANGVMRLAVEGARELPEYAADRINLKRVLKRPGAGADLLQPGRRALRPGLRPRPFVAGLRAFAAAHSAAVDRG